MKVATLAAVSQKIDDPISHTTWDIRAEDLLEKKTVINQVECLSHFNRTAAAPRPSVA